MRKKKVFDDEWKAKQVWTKLDRKQSSSYAYKNTLGKYKNSIRKSTYFGSKISIGSNTKQQKEVVVKVTGASRNFERLKAHLRYISRNGDLEIETSSWNRYEGKENLKELCDSFNACSKIPTQSYIETNALKEQREALHIVFSMKDEAYAPPKKIKESAMKTISEMYPNNYYAVAVHTDTDNPHCHLVLKMQDIYGKHINPKKADLAKMRVKFAENLRELGVEAKATIKEPQLNDNRGFYLESDYKKSEHKAHHYEVINFGKAPYKFNQDNQESFFVRYRTSKGKDIDIWADDLERVIAENDIHIGEYVRFAITGEEPKSIKIQDPKSKQWYEKTIYKKTWNASIENRNEKVLNPLKYFTPNDYKKIDEPFNKIVDFGEAPYKFTKNNAPSFYVTMTNHFGKEFTIWGKELENLINENDLQVGDEAIFEKPKVEKKPDENFVRTQWFVKLPYDKEREKEEQEEREQEKQEQGNVADEREIINNNDQNNVEITKSPTKTNKKNSDKSRAENQSNREIE